MPNPEINHPAEYTGETSDETTRQIYKSRGEVANEQVYEETPAPIQDVLLEMQKLGAMQNQLRDELKHNKELSQQLLADIEQEEHATTIADQETSPPAEDHQDNDSGAEKPSAETTDDKFNYIKEKNNPTLKKIITVIVSLIAAGAAVALIWQLIKNSNKDASNQGPTGDTGPTETSTEPGGQEADLPAGEDKEAKGIYDGYDKKGMWLSSSKSGDYDFSAAKEVAEVCDNDECEMVKYTAHNQVESYADYLANLPEALQPEGFKGLTILETEKKLEGLSDEEFETIKQQFENTIDGAFTRDTVLNGYYHNSYMRPIDSSKPIIHENMELVKCDTYENGTKAVEFYWTDDGTANGKVIGTMTVKIWRDGNGGIAGGCIQVVNPISSGTELYTGMEEVPENPLPQNPTTPHQEVPTTEPTTEPTTKPKDSGRITDIDTQTLYDIADDILSDKVDVTPSSGVSNSGTTSKPSSGSYEGTGPQTTPNQPSQSAEPVQGSGYTDNRGGAHDNEYSPVQDDQNAQDAADNAEIPIDEAPVGGTDLQDILGDLGIN